MMCYRLQSNLSQATASTSQPAHLLGGLPSATGSMQSSVQSGCFGHRLTQRFVNVGAPGTFDSQVLHNF